MKKVQVVKSESKKEMRDMKKAFGMKRKMARKEKGRR